MSRARIVGLALPLAATLMAVGGASAAPPPAPGALKVGATAPTRAVLRDLEGKVMDLGLQCGRDARWNKKRPAALLVDFYMTTCGPCNAALPDLGALATAYQERKVRTLLVSLDGSEHAPGGVGISNAGLRTKVAAAKLPDSGIVRDPGRVMAEDFGIVVEQPGKGRTVAVPRTFVLDAECVVRGVYTDLAAHSAELRTLLDGLVAKPTPAP